MKSLLAAIVCASGLVVPAAVSAQSLSHEDVRALALEAVQQQPDLVLKIILDNPEVVMQAIEILRERSETEEAGRIRAVLEGQRELLINDPNAPVLGNPDGDVTIIEFFDYNCPYCKQARNAVADLIDGDANVRVVYREWPILGEGSVFAARAALAARKQDLYAVFHEALMSHQGRLTEASVMHVARRVGLDTDRLRVDMSAPDVSTHIDTSRVLAQSLSFTGTPAFIVGDALVPGLVTVDQLQALVRDAREAG